MSTRGRNQKSLWLIVEEGKGSPGTIEQRLEMVEMIEMVEMVEMLEMVEIIEIVMVQLSNA